MKFLFCGDSHGDWTTGGVERFDEVQAARRHTIDVAKAERVDLYVDLGDVTDPDVEEGLSHRAIAACVEAGVELRDAGIPSAWLTGNHDIIEDGRGSHVLMSLREAGLLVVDGPRSMQFSDQLAVTWLPYVASDRRYDPVDVIRRFKEWMAPTTERVIVIGHATRIVGLEVGSETNDMPRGRDLVFPVDECRKLAPAVLMVNGHYHRRHLGTVDNLITPGSMIRCTHGEEDFTPGFVIVEW